MSIMKITKIERQKNNENRFSVYIDGKFSFGIGETDLTSYNLSESLEISTDYYERIMSDLVVKRAKFLAFKYLSYKNRTEKELYDKLASYNEFDEDVITGTINFLKKLGYINDDEYARSFIKQKSTKNLDGSYKIKYMLSQKGISSDISSESLGIDEAENAAKIIERKLRKLKRNINCTDEITYEDKRKLFAYLSRKGYSYSVINDAFRQIGSEIDIDWE